MIFVNMLKENKYSNNAISLLPTNFSIYSFLSLVSPFLHIYGWMYMYTHTHRHPRDSITCRSLNVILPVFFVSDT